MRDAETDSRGEDIAVSLVVEKKEKTERENPNVDKLFPQTCDLCEESEADPLRTLLLHLDE